MTQDQAIPGQPGEATTGKRKGFTLIELAIALAVIGGLIVTIISMQGETAGSGKLLNGKQELNLLAERVRQTYSTSSSMGNGDITGELLDYGSVPDRMVNNNAIQNAWGGPIAITADDTRFDIETTNMPLDACSQIAQVEVGGQGAGGLVDVAINGRAVGAPVSVADAGAECDREGPSNSVTFTLMKM